MINTIQNYFKKKQKAKEEAAAAAEAAIQFEANVLREKAKSQADMLVKEMMDAGFIVLPSRLGSNDPQHIIDNDGRLAMHAVLAGRLYNVHVTARGFRWFEQIR